MTNLQLPNNLTKTFQPEIIKADNYSEGFAKTLEGLDQVFGEFRSAMFLLSNTTTSNITSKCQCYDDQTSNRPAQLKNYITSIFPQKNRPEPIQYLFTNKKDDQDETEKWVLNSKDKDLVTFNGMAYGFEHNLVVVFQVQASKYFLINECMRSTGMLIIVQLPAQKLVNLCFGKCNSITESN